MPIPLILTNPLQALIARTIVAQGGWLGFDDFMSMALYTPGLGYYANANLKFGLMPYGAGSSAGETGDSGETGEGSDFATAPEMTPLFGQALAQQVAQALRETHTDEIWEFGAGSGALAAHLLAELSRLGRPVARYTIVDLSGELRSRQQARLVEHGDVVCWADALPQQMQGVLIGNEVIDAMPVQLLARQGGVWFERGVALHPSAKDAALQNTAATSLPDPKFVWADRPTDLRPTMPIEGEHDYVTETHREALAFVSTLADKLVRGAVFLVDYGFPEAEYYHPQRHMGTVMCHQAHRSDTNPLADVGLKDITAHVNFTGLAMAAQDAGLEVLGYCTQARFLMNCGLLEKLQGASFAEKAMAQKLILEHEMGELFKVIGFAKGASWQALGFAQGDRCHTL